MVCASWCRSARSMQDQIPSTLARQRIRLSLIARNWDDMLRVAGSLLLGTVRASELLRSLLRSGRPSTLARAIGELGRIPKTLYLLCYIDDETHRRRILLQLNRREGATGSPERRSMGSAGNYASGIAKGRKINSAHWAWWSTSSCCGTRSIWSGPRLCARRGRRCEAGGCGPVVAPGVQAYQLPGAVLVRPG